MTRISILGATGKVGTALRDLIESSPSLAMVEAINSTGEGDTVSLADATFSKADVLVDFSTPTAVMALLDRLENSALPLVIGTTGFSQEQAARLQAEGCRRPILIGANFTKGFETFAATATALAKSFPDADITIGEVYKATKKPVPSGTTQRLSVELGAATGHEVDLDIQRIGDTPGINSVLFNYKVASLRLELTVNTRTAYAAGALDAALWLTGQPDGLYSPKDILEH
jgi:4-hydroxy-tetrahydrodipicolinate reductase